MAQFLQHKQDKIFEFCVHEIKSSGGKITAREPERLTGYSSRWLHMKFSERLGISPKTLASIIRFKLYNEAPYDGNSGKFNRNNSYYDSWYDQSHLIKDFKRYTRLTPTRLEKKINEWGRLFYNA